MIGALHILIPPDRIPFAAGLVITAGIVLLMRAVFCRLVRGRAFAERVLILGTSPLASELIEVIENQPRRRYAIVGLADDRMVSGVAPLRYPLLGPLEDLWEIIQEVRPDRIIVALPDRRGLLPARQLLECRVRGILVEDGAEAYERLTGKLAIEWLTSSGLIYSEGLRRSRLALAAGRAISLLVSAIGLLLLAPILGLIALAIKWDSRGPVFFVQDRVGMGGRPFELIKFRTMHPATKQTSEWARDNGDRITRVGRWLRKFRLDELPQFVNVLRGDMNLVGPRPHPLSNFDLLVVVSRNAPECGEQIPYYALRSMVRPGITGWAQVRYRYANNLEEEIEKMRYDLYYIKHQSLWLDLRILFETVKTVLLGRGTGTRDAHQGEVPTGTPAGDLFHDPRRGEGLRVA